MTFSSFSLSNKTTWYKILGVVTLSYLGLITAVETWGLVIILDMYTRSPFNATVEGFVINNSQTFTIPVVLGFTFLVIAQRCITRNILQKIHIYAVIAGVGGILFVMFGIYHVLNFITLS